ncbi:hypothetical protein Bca101_016531 [Brassica carinata]
MEGKSEEGGIKPYYSSLRQVTNSDSSRKRTNIKSSSPEENLNPSNPNPQIFQERLDRHGNPFGERVGTKQTRNPPPARSNQEPEVLKQTGKTNTTQERTHSYASPPYAKHRGLTSQKMQKGRDLFPHRSQGQWRPIQMQASESQIEKDQPLIEAGPEETSSARDINCPNNNNLKSMKEAIMEELQEATRQYLSCPDPAEAAARRQRVHFSDANGLMEETAASMLASAQAKIQASSRIHVSNSNPVTPPPLQENNLNDLLIPAPSVCCTPPTRREEDLNDAPHLNDASLQGLDGAAPARLKSIIVSPANEEDKSPAETQREQERQEEEETLSEFQNKVRRRTTRTIKRKNPRNSPNLLRGTSSKKRKLSQIQSSPGSLVGTSAQPPLRNPTLQHVEKQMIQQTNTIQAYGV